MGGEIAFDVSLSLHTEVGGKAIGDLANEQSVENTQVKQIDIPVQTPEINICEVKVQCEEQDVRDVTDLEEDRTLDNPLPTTNDLLPTLKGWGFLC